MICVICYRQQMQLLNAISVANGFMKWRKLLLIKAPITKAVSDVHTAIEFLGWFVLY